VPLRTQVSRTIKLVGSRAQHLRLSEISTDKPELKAEAIRDKGQYALRITFTAGDREGRFNGRITAKTDLDSPKQIQLNVTAQVVGDLVCNRRFVMFNPYNPSSARQQVIHIKSLSGKPFRISNVTGLPSNMTAKAQPTGKGWNVELSLTGEPGEPRGKFSIQTDREDQPVIHVSYAVREKTPSHQKRP
jgi:hypothetical protein